MLNSRARVLATNLRTAMWVAMIGAGVMQLACSSTIPDSAQVYFRTDAPFCGPMLVEKSIDGAVVARDTMSSAKPSVPYTVSPGVHLLHARALYLDGSGKTLYAWPDSTVTLSAGGYVTRTLSLYCS